MEFLGIKKISIIEPKIAIRYMMYLTEYQQVTGVKKRQAPKNLSHRAQDETRTHTILRPLPPQSSVYTNFTTCAECPEQDSNLHTSRHAHLKRTRLPIPPSGQKKRAENETRTRDPDLGKVVLYQLSYFRNFFDSKS